MDTKQKIFYALKKYYGFDTLRRGQFEIINSILNGVDTFCLMPTGAGKSICYQIPAIIMQGVTIVISPLISLMKDQVDNLVGAGIKAAYINSTQNMDTIRSILIEASMGEYKIIYISPERLESKIFRELIKDLHICQIAIDEAHCVSQWGHDFRQSYLGISDFYKSLKIKPIISAFTATATSEVREDSIKLLGLEKPYIYKGDINRENLSLNILKEVDKIETVKDIIRKNEGESGIVYCASRNEVDNLYYYLRDLGFNVGKYHGGLKDEEKERFQEEFLYENLDVIIATNAFGMGIDKSNIRFIVHFTFPQNLESYYQEIGRGGRDGEDCDCYLFYCEEDISRVEYIINRSSSMNRREIQLRKFQFMIDYCNLKECYRKYILNYFGNDRKLNYCNKCSNCLNDDELKDFTKESQMILSTVFRTKEQYGISVLVDILKGFKGPKIIQNNLDKVTTYGIMKEYGSTFIKELIKRLLDDGYVDLKEGTYSMLKLNSRSIRVLKSKESVVFKILDSREPIINTELFEALKSWRKDRAYKDKIKPYIIFSDTSLIAISNSRPRTLDELLEIRGVGTKKIEAYGGELLNIIKMFAQKEAN
ncbi:DNA helicase RecQ [Clostridium beijerinckii]|jgi:ATP-dependent DNA helicase RecQ (EC 3.6.1.-)|uniref:DNA helicase RecQ n=2 Tax=Clostridium beijerinckii TaxID=1520 RepID=A0AAE2RNU6_CLOBE|nr:DNA helicase RecQ [Clostridium beijerinckii]ABR36584.1 ATP-dependent DNA helicase RecQ [Clostridium beijerinckii NCIMB 8052]AIU04154.1 ATP-dependent DNA helicase RecQ [Clostridium beijerinckii ATCC 35702]MBF7808768.1 DNA helicase RecQ [Clostridium beijerinckii]NRT22347.1 ATP-dependent DNA helicase RecQ [Clostridium beijerinckii]NRT65140.1 ATP-dependent DNA helicase RecQ [Clostridium beijerinckii]